MNNAWKLIQGYIARVPHGAAIGYVVLVLLFAFMTLTSVSDVLDRRASVAEAVDTLAQLEGRIPKRGNADAAGVTGSPVLEGPTVTVAGAVLLRRAAATGIRMSSLVKLLYQFSTMHPLEGVHPLQSGIFRLRHPDEPLVSRAFEQICRRYSIIESIDYARLV